MRRAIAVIVAIVFTVIAAALLIAMLEVSDLPRCDDPGAVQFADEDDCIEGSSARRAVGLTLGWASTVAAALAALFGFAYAAGRARGFAVAACALATPVLALAALMLLPISF